MAWLPKKYPTQTRKWFHSNILYLKHKCLCWVNLRPLILHWPLYRSKLLVTIYFMDPRIVQKRSFKVCEQQQQGNLLGWCNCGEAAPTFDWDYENTTLNSVTCNESLIASNDWNIALNPYFLCHDIMIILLFVYSRLTGTWGMCPKELGLSEN